jgi:phage terminase large subunit-like protein
VDEATLAGTPCYLALDLSKKNDLTALARVWKSETGHLYIKLTYWKPKDGLAQAEAEDRAPYAKWVEMAQLIATPGKTIGQDFIVAEVKRATVEHDVQLMAFDPAFFADFQQAASDAAFDCYEVHPDKPAGTGLKMIRHAQGARGMHSEKTLWFPRSFQALCDAILESRITIDRSGLTTYCASNVALETDAQGNQWLSKKRSRGHIDGITAAVMAVGAAMHQPAKPVFRSIWETL